MACTILQKQIEHINGQRENITIPSVAIKRIREQAQTGNLSRCPINLDLHMYNIVEGRARELTVSTSPSSINSSGDNNVEMTTSSAESDINETSRGASSTTSNTVRNHTNNTSNIDPSCELCLTNEWYLALLPCAHVRTDVLREHSL
jgi:hypothetical protein